MNIAIDLSPLQGPHRMRGIGYTVIHFINNIPESDRKQNRYVFYVLPASVQQYDPLDLLNLDGFSYETRELKKGWKLNLKLPGKLRYITHAVNEVLRLVESSLGDSRVGSLKGLDVFLQCDQSQILPRRRFKVDNALIVYDIIPYVLEWDYLWSYKTAKARGYSWKGASVSVLRRYIYKRNLRINVRRAHKIISISKSTASDFLKNFRFKESKMQVVSLGIPEKTSVVSAPELKKYNVSSWGNFPTPFKTKDLDVPFLLFVGGADRRRKLEDLVGAFNILKAQGHQVKLVLVGDSMQGPNTVSTRETQRAIMESSYLSDIVFMGFTDDASREWLYEHALAFVFPSRYEGFGLPVLEAMQYGTPVISYKNDATIEVAGELPMYAESALDIAQFASRLLQDSFSDKERKAYVSHASKYDWAKTSSSISSLLKD